MADPREPREPRELREPREPPTHGVGDTTPNKVLWWFLGIVAPLLLTAMAGLGLILYQGVIAEIHQLRLEHLALESRTADHVSEGARAMGALEQLDRRVSLLEGRRTGFLDFNPVIYLADYERRP